MSNKPTIKYIKPNGQPVPRGHCVTPDHWQHKLLMPLKPSVEEIQKQHKVLNIKVDASGWWVTIQTSDQAFTNRELADATLMESTCIVK